MESIRHPLQPVASGWLLFLDLSRKYAEISPLVKRQSGLCGRSGGPALRAGILLAQGIFFLTCVLLSSKHPTTQSIRSEFFYGYEYVITYKFIGSKFLWVTIAIAEMGIGIASYIAHWRFFFYLIFLWSLLRGIWTICLAFINAFNIGTGFSSSPRA